MGEGSIARWQNRLVPLMVAMVVFAALFFSIVSLREFQSVKAMLGHSSPALESVLRDYDRFSPSNLEEAQRVARNKALFILETESVARRYEQAHAIILARLWTRFMAFTTGTLMALIGAAFILGKISEEPSEVTGSASGASISVRSASPGILLAAFGTALIGAALFSYFDVQTTDPPPYMTPVTADATPTSAANETHLSRDAVAMIEKEDAERAVLEQRAGTGGANDSTASAVERRGQ